MGRDIHVVLEKKTDSGWAFFDPGFTAFDGRFYAFFQFLEEISEPGCPDELKDQRLRIESLHQQDRDGERHEKPYAVWDTTKESELYGFGRVRLDRLEQASGWLNTFWVSTDFLNKFRELGGVLPEGMFLLSEEADDRKAAVGVRTADEDDLYLQDYIHEGVTELKRIAREYGLRESELRVCFAFDW